MNNKFFTKKNSFIIMGTLLVSVAHTGLVHSEMLINKSIRVSLQDKKSTAFNGWTAERLKNAKPKLMQIEPEFDSNVTGYLTKKSEGFFEDFNDQLPTESWGQPGQAPDQESKPNYNNQVFEAPIVIAKKARTVEGSVSTLVEHAGTRVAPYTSSKLIPESARMHYPYRTAGKLFFIDDDGDSACSAAVISPRLIVTAGHCLHNGNGHPSGWHSKFLFIPALENGNAPFSTWKGTQQAWVNPDWFSGGGDVGDIRDIGLLVLEDQTLPHENRSTRIGDQVGWLGWQTYALSHNHVHMLGYPTNFDQGLKMHQVTSQAYRSKSGGRQVEYGSDMEGGSSGGPWIENLGTDSRIVGVTSYGYDDPDIKLQGSSSLNNDFSDGLEKLCALRKSNCKR